MDCSPPGPSVHGIFQARVLEWAAIAFSAMSYSLPNHVKVKIIKILYKTVIGLKSKCLK